MTTTGSAPSDAPEGMVTPDSPAWDEARSAWNLAADQRPDAVVMARSADDVAAAVRYAAREGLRVAVQSTGHGASAHGDLAGTLLINMAGMRGVTVDTDARVARAKGGAQWQDVLAVTAPHGLTALHGSAHDVGVVGYTVGGGLGWLARKHGLACNAVTAVEVVLPDGTARRLDADADGDGFWAMRGGGGGFGVITAMEFRLFPLTEAYAGWLIWPWERSEEILGAWSAWCADAPEDVTSVGRILQLPPIPDLPEEMRGAKLVVVEACFVCDREEADRLLAPLRALGPVKDTFDLMPAAALTMLHMDPPEPVPGIADGGLLDTFPTEAAAALAAAAGPGSGSPLLSVEVRHLGGALDRIPEGAGALAFLDGEFALFAVGLPMTPEMGEAIDASITNVLQTMGRWGFGRRYLNFAERPIDARSAFDGGAVERLQAARDAADPERILRPNHDVAPAA
ncbi:MAG: FAD-binding oxidoreductase [Thermoleophilia bacterium]